MVLKMQCLVHSDSYINTQIRDNNITPTQTKCHLFWLYCHKLTTAGVKTALRDNIHFRSKVFKIFAPYHKLPLAKIAEINLWEAELNYTPFTPVGKLVPTPFLAFLSILCNWCGAVETAT